MSLLRFDPSGSLHPEFGITEDQIAGLADDLTRLRQEMVEMFHGAC